MFNLLNWFSQLPIPLAVGLLAIITIVLNATIAWLLSVSNAKSTQRNIEKSQRDKEIAVKSYETQSRLFLEALEYTTTVTNDIQFFFFDVWKQDNFADAPYPDIATYVTYSKLRKYSLLMKAINEIEFADAITKLSLVVNKFIPNASEPESVEERDVENISVIVNEIETKLVLVATNHLGLPTPMKKKR